MQLPATIISRLTGDDRRSRGTAKYWVRSYLERIHSTPLHRKQLCFLMWYSVSHLPLKTVEKETLKAFKSALVLQYDTIRNFSSIEFMHSPALIIYYHMLTQSAKPWRSNKDDSGFTLLNVSSSTTPQSLLLKKNTKMSTSTIPQVPRAKAKANWKPQV